MVKIFIIASIIILIIFALFTVYQNVSRLVGRYVRVSYNQLPRKDLNKPPEPVGPDKFQISMGGVYVTINQHHVDGWSTESMLYMNLNSGIYLVDPKNSQSKKKYSIEHLSDNKVKFTTTVTKNGLDVYHMAIYEFQPAENFENFTENFIADVYGNRYLSLSHQRCLRDPTWYYDGYLQAPYKIMPLKHSIR